MTNRDTREVSQELLTIQSMAEGEPRYKAFWSHMIFYMLIHKNSEVIQDKKRTQYGWVNRKINQAK